MDVADRVLLIVIDGVADRPVYRGKPRQTPLDAAVTPNLDMIATRGVSGIMDTISPGVRPGSDTSHLAILGYDPYEYYTGRGPFEAAGVGIPVKPGDIAFRANFATLEGNMVTDRRAGRIRDTTALAETIQREVKLPVDLIFKRSTGHRAALVFRGEGLSADVTATDPKHEGRPQPNSEATSPEGERTAEILNEFTRQAHEILEAHPINEVRRAAGEPLANTILSRGAGVVPHMPSLRDMYGLRSAVVAAAGLIIGIGRMAGMEYIETPGATGGIDSNVDGKIKNALRALEDHEIVLLNVKGADEAGHDGDWDAKKNFVEKIDSALRPVAELADTLIIICSDHTTPVSVMDHSGDPVPLAIAGPGVRTDGVGVFSECAAARGGLSRLRGVDVMPIAMDLMNQAKKFGA